MHEKRNINPLSDKRYHKHTNSNIPW